MNTEPTPTHALPCDPRTPLPDSPTPLARQIWTAQSRMHQTVAKVLPRNDAMGLTYRLAWLAQEHPLLRIAWYPISVAVCVAMATAFTIWNLAASLTHRARTGVWSHNQSDVRDI